MLINNYDRSDDKTGIPLAVGERVTRFIYDGLDSDFINGTVVGVAEESFDVKWDHLIDPAEYKWEDIAIHGNEIIVDHLRKVK